MYIDRRILIDRDSMWYLLDCYCYLCQNFYKKVLSALAVFEMVWIMSYAETIRASWKDYQLNHFTDDYYLVKLNHRSCLYTSIPLSNSLIQTRLSQTCFVFAAPRQYPRHVAVFPHTEHSVKVTWQGVMTDWDEETLQGYIVSTNVQADSSYLFLKLICIRFKI